MNTVLSCKNNLNTIANDPMIVGNNGWVEELQVKSRSTTWDRLQLSTTEEMWFLVGRATEQSIVPRRRRGWQLGYQGPCPQQQQQHKYEHHPRL